MTRVPAATNTLFRPRTELQATDRELKASLHSVQAFQDVARMLEIRPGLLRAVLYGVRERRRYKSFTIPRKNGGSRSIQSPPKNLKILQKKVNKILRLIYNPRACVHGFARRRSVKSNADMHKNKRWVLNVDLKDFFDHITIGRVIGVLENAPFDLMKAPATVLAQIATLDNGRLPQGSPCSPILSNLVAYDLDRRLTQIAHEQRCTYSRYADDLTFSTSRRRFPSELAELHLGKTELGENLAQAIEDAGFPVNQRKVRLQNLKHRQEVTGLTVNEFPNVRRSYIRAIRGILHAWRKYGEKATEQELQTRTGKSVSLRHHVRGKLAYLTMVRGRHDPIVRRLSKQFSVVCSELAPSMPSVVELPSIPLRGHRSPSLVWEDRFRQLRDSIQIIEITMRGEKEGSTETGGGTAFKIADQLLATAGHNLEHGKVSAGLTDGIELEKVNHLNVPFGVDVGLLKPVAGAPLAGRILSSQCRLPEIGEQVAAIGFPNQPCRLPSIALNVGVVESLPTNYWSKCRFIQVSFQSAGGMSGSPLIDRGGHVLGIVVENTGRQANEGEPSPRSFGQVVPFEYVYDLLYRYPPFAVEPGEGS